MRGWGEHSTALCHWAETSTQEAETIRVAWRCCFPSWDSHPTLTGPLPPSAEPGDTDSSLLPQRWNCSFSLLLLRWIRQPIHGSLEWQGNQISELKNTLKKSLLPKHCRQNDLLETKFRSCHILAYNPPPTWNKTQSPYWGLPKASLFPLCTPSLGTPALPGLPVPAGGSL